MRARGLRRGRRLCRTLLAGALVCLLVLNPLLPARALDEGEEAEPRSVAGQSEALRGVSKSREKHAALTPGRRNLVKRACQLTDIRWTPVRDFSGWKDKEEYRFYAGVTYTGIPYGQPHRSGRYVPWQTGLTEFLEQVSDRNSRMFSDRAMSQIKRNVAPYYSCECSAFVSWAWGLPQRETTHTLDRYGTRVNGDWTVLEVGDCLLQAGKHAKLVTDMIYDADGRITGIEIAEEKAPMARRLWYRTGDRERPLSALQTEFLDKGYIILRYTGRDAVRYTHSCAVPLAGDLCPACGVNPFRDLRLNAWYTRVVAFVNNQGIMTGTAKDRFSPDQSVTRAMMVTMLWRMYYCPAGEAELPFRDLRAGAYYETALRWAYEKGCVSGTSRRHFSPNAPCTRAQIVTFLWRAAGKPQARQTDCPFADVRRDGYYYQALLWAVEQGIIKGKTETRFAPEAEATRAETAAMITRACACLGLYT